VGQSRVTLVFPKYETEPLSMTRLEHILVQQGLFSKIQALCDIMEKGIIDFVAHSY